MYRHSKLQSYIHLLCFIPVQLFCRIEIASVFNYKGGLIRTLNIH